MARPKQNVQSQANNRGYWQEEIAKAQSRADTFHQAGKRVEDRYMLEGAQVGQEMYKDRYNILYSSTETMKPSLYAKTPKVQATQRHPDRQNVAALGATMLMENVGQYALEEVEFDEVVKNAVKDFLLPGLGTAWVRYEPKFATGTGADGQPYESLAFEGMALDYVNWKDILFGMGRVWAELPWVARRVYFTKKKATKRFGEEKANKLQYTYNNDAEAKNKDSSNDQQAIIYEIWDKENGRVVWYSDDYSDTVLDEIADPLKLSCFFPCPQPMRAVFTTNRFIPKSFYSQYKAQAEELDDLTQKIRTLTQALKLVGVYDGSQVQLANLLSGTSNKMVGIENWAAFAGAGGLKGALEWVPVKEVAEVLSSLLANREVVKNEIYEITGFSDIVRGVSKASETLGAQEIKSNWAGGRLRDMQAEVQRFCRDLIRIMTEIIVEQFSEDSLAVYAGFEPPEVTPEEQKAAAQYAASLTMPPQPDQPPVPQPGPTGKQIAIQEFLAVVKLLKDEKKRCALIGIETDSTIQPDEAAERKDRLEFLGQIGAFMQQAGPMALQYPDMRGLLGAIMMFVVRTFRSSRPVEKEFEAFQKSLANAPPMPPPGEGGEGTDPAAAQAQVQGEQIKAQATVQAAQVSDATKRYEIDTKAQLEREKMQAEMQYKQRELDLKERELVLKERELQVQAQQAEREAEAKAVDQSIAQVTAIGSENRAERQQEHSEAMDMDGADRADRQLEADAKAAQAKPKKAT